MTLVPIDVPAWIQAGTGIAALFVGLSSRRRRQVVEWGDMLARLSGLSQEDLRRVVEDHEVAAEIVGIAWEQAARTASEDKRYLLAKVAASALRGDTTPEQIDRLQFLLRPLLALDPPHITLLVLIGNSVDRTGASNDADDQRVTLEDLATSWAGGTSLLDPGIAALEREGLVQVVLDYGGSARWCKLRPFGAEFLDYLLVDAGGWPPRHY